MSEWCSIIALQNTRTTFRAFRLYRLLPYRCLLRWIAVGYGGLLSRDLPILSFPRRRVKNTGTHGHLLMTQAEKDVDITDFDSIIHEASPRVLGYYLATQQVHTLRARPSSTSHAQKTLREFQNRSTPNDDRYRRISYHPISHSTAFDQFRLCGAPLSSVKAIIQHPLHNRIHPNLSSSACRLPSAQSAYWSPLNPVPRGNHPIQPTVNQPHLLYPPSAQSAISHSLQLVLLRSASPGAGYIS